ncbi:hypothetical protein ACFX2C_022542 [Malus domestica]
METASKMVEKATAFTSGKSSTEAKEKVEALNKDMEAGQGSSNVNSEEGQGSGIGIQNEYRICQDKDYLHKLKAPCRCNGTLKGTAAIERAVKRKEEKFDGELQVDRKKKRDRRHPCHPAEEEVAQ